MKFKIKKIEEEITYRKTFDPFRILFKIESNEFDKLINKALNNNLAALGAIETIFAINEIFSNGFNDNYRNEFGKFFAELDTIQIILSYFSEYIYDDKAKNLFEDIRISIQNFMYNIFIRSYYIAYGELRKVLEAIIWIEKLKFLDSFPERVDDNGNYKKELIKINPSLSEIWTTLNSFSHSNSEMPVFNINRIYNPKDWIFIINNSIFKVADDITKHLFSVVDLIEENSNVKRFKKLVHCLKIARNSYDLKNYGPEPTEEVFFPKGNQDIFAMAILNEINTFKIDILISQYYYGVCKILEDVKTYTKYNYKGEQFDPMILSWKYLYQYDERFNHLCMYLNEERISQENENSNNIKRIIMSSNPTIKNFRKQANYLKEIFRYEIKFGGNLDIAILKSLFEDAFFSSSEGKIVNPLILNLIKEFLENKFKIIINEKKISEQFKYFTKHRHINYKKRIKYKTLKSIDNRVSGNEENTDEFLNLLNYMAKLFLEKFFLK